MGTLTFNDHLIAFDAELLYPLCEMTAFYKPALVQKKSTTKVRVERFILTVDDLLSAFSKSHHAISIVFHTGARKHDTSRPSSNDFVHDFALSALHTSGVRAEETRRLRAWEARQVCAACGGSRWRGRESTQATVGALEIGTGENGSRGWGGRCDVGELA